MVEERRRNKTLAIVLGIFALIGLVASVTAWWVHQTVLDTDSWVAIVTDIVEDEDILVAVSQAVGDQAVEVLDLGTRIESALPEDLQLLVLPLTAWAEAFVRDRADDVVRSDFMHTVWIESNRIAHSRAVAIVRGDLGPLDVENGEVVLDLTGLVNEVLGRVEDVAGQLLGSDLAVAASDALLSEEAVAELEERLGRDLPDDFGRIVVFQSDELAAAQKTVRALDLVAFVLPVLTILLFAGAWWVSPDRAAGGIWLLGGAAGALLLAWVVVGLGEASLVSAIATPGSEAPVESVIAPFIGRLRQWMFVLLAVALGAFIWLTWLSDRGSGAEAELTESVEDDADIAEEPVG